MIALLYCHASINTNDNKPNNESKMENTNKIPLKKITIYQKLRKLISISQPELWKLSVAFSALGVNSITNLSFPWIIGQAIDKASDTNDPNNFYKFFIGTASIFCIGN